jgi:hypothetical protein
MNDPLIIRVPAPLGERLLAAQLVTRTPSETRSGPLEIAVHASLVVKDVASVLLALAAGARGIRTVLDWVRREAPDLDAVVIVHSPDAEHSWSLKPGPIDDAMIEEITRAVRAAAADSEPPTEAPASGTP